MWKIVSFAVAIMLFLIFLINQVEATSISSGENYSYSYSYVNRNCSANTSLTVVNEETFYCLSCSNESVELDISLNSGETETGVEGICSYTASCSSEDSPTEASCIIDQRLDSGEDYKLNSGACDVEVECAVCEVESLGAELKRIDWTVDYDFNGSYVDLIIGENEVAVPFGNGGFTYQGSTNILCPSETDDEVVCWDRMTSNEQYTACRTYDPLTSWFPTIIDNTLTSMDNYRTQTDKVLNEDMPKYVGCVEDLASCRADLGIRLNASEEMIVKSESRERVCLGELNSYKTYFPMLGIIALFELIAICGLLFFIFKKGGD